MLKVNEVTNLIEIMEICQLLYRNNGLTTCVKSYET